MRPLINEPTSIDVARHATSAESFGNHRPPISPWHSTGGLVPTLACIVFALLILACSYWLFSTSCDDSGEGTGGRVDEEKDSRSGKKSADEETIVVIMAGDNFPRFLATPAANKCVCGHEGKIVISKEASGVAEEIEETATH